MSDKPKPLKVFGRTHYACTRCKLSKIKCLGEKPACANCKAVNKERYCQYPSRDRKIMIMELDLNKLHARVQHLEELVRTQGPSTPDPSPMLRSELMVQKRVLKLLAQDSYILPDTESERIPYRLLLLCADQLPEEQYAWKLLDLVCKTYSSEFYLVDADSLGPLVSETYKFFRTTDLRNLASVELLREVQPVSLCYLFALLAFGEQMHNNTLESLPPSIAEVTGGDQKIPGLEFHTTATKLFNVAHEEIDMRYIQSAMTLGLFACNLNRYNTVYNFFGVALRSAVAKGYHRQMETPPNLSIEQLRKYRIYEEKTKRLWWSVYVVDVVWAAKMNMPVHIDYTDTDVALPNESPILDLNDGFNSEILDGNVQLVKYVGKFNSLIYGPNTRTFSMNYINTEKFNQSMLIKNVIESLSEIVTQFESFTLLPYKKVSIVLLLHRNTANLCLRFNQLIILVIEPLLALVYKKATAANIENNEEVAKSISKGVLAAARTVMILLKIYEHNKLFVLGFWDSQHLFTATLVLITCLIAGNKGLSYYFDRAIALQKYMAENNNINAKNAMKKLEIAKSYIENIPEVSVKLNLNTDISRYVTKKTPPLNGTAALNEYFNPFTEDLIEDTDISHFVSQTEGLMFDRFGFSNYSEQSQSVLQAMGVTFQSWDNFRGLPIHVSGTGRVEAQDQRVSNQPLSTNNFHIQNFI